MTRLVVGLEIMFGAGSTPVACLRVIAEQRGVNTKSNRPRADFDFLSPMHAHPIQRHPFVRSCFGCGKSMNAASCQLCAIHLSLWVVFYFIFVCVTPTTTSYICCSNEACVGPNLVFLAGTNALFYVPTPSKKSCWDVWCRLFCEREWTVTSRGDLIFPRTMNTSPTLTSFVQYFSCIDSSFRDGI